MARDPTAVAGSRAPYHDPRRDRDRPRPSARRRGARAFRRGPLLHDRLHGDVREAPVGGGGNALVLRRGHRALPPRVPRVPRGAVRRADRARGVDHPRLLRRLPAHLPDRLVQPGDDAVARAVGEGDGEVPAPLPLPRRRRLAHRAARHSVLLAHPRRVRRRGDGERRLRRRAAPGCRGDGAEPRRGLAAAADGRREQDQHLRRDRGAERLSDQRADGRPEPPRDRARRGARAAAADLPAARGGAPVADASRRACSASSSSWRSRRSRGAGCSGSAAASSSC